MNDKQEKERKIMHVGVSFVRLLLSFFFVIVFVELGDGMGEAEMWTVALFVLYTLGMVLVGFHPKGMFVDALAIGGMVLYLQEPLLMVFLLFPIALSMVFRVSVGESAILAVIYFVIIGFGFGWGIETLFVVIALASWFFVKEVIVVQQRKEWSAMGQEKQFLLSEKRELDAELMNINKELGNLSRLFVRLKDLNRIIDISEIHENLIQAPMAVFNAEYAVLYRLNDEGSYVLVKEKGNKSAYKVPKRLKKEAGELPILKEKFIHVPLQFEEENWGIVRVYGKRERLVEGQMSRGKFDDGDYERLALYCEQAMFSLRTAKLMNELDTLAHNDTLTGVPNRRSIENQWDYLIKRAARGEELAVVILDIDNFKSFNDTYGHAVGDVVLKEVAECLEQFVRETDYVGRLGGEEFGILIPNSNDMAVEVANRVRKKVSLIPFDRQITISMGLAYYGEELTTRDDMFKAADMALYYSKHHGKNCVTEHSKEVEEKVEVLLKKDK